jgi:hypothetical protein
MFLPACHQQRGLAFTCGDRSTFNAPGLSTRTRTYVNRHVHQVSTTICEAREQIFVKLRNRDCKQMMLLWYLTRANHEDDSPSWC